MDDRVRADYVAKKTSLNVRTIQQMASKGLIPGAAKLGGAWTFNVRKLDEWVRQAEERHVECHGKQRRETSTSAMVSGGPVSRLPDIAIDLRYERLISAKPKSGSKAGGKNSKGALSASRKTVRSGKPLSAGERQFYLVQ